jgi:putative DNA primase/helicase
MTSTSERSYPEFPADRNPDASDAPYRAALSSGKKTQDGWSPPASAVPPSLPIRPFDTWTAERTTNGHGFAFAQLFGHICRYSYALMCWFVYDGRAWRRDDGSKTAELRQFARLRFQEDADRYRRLVRKRHDEDDESASDSASKDAGHFANHVRATLSTPKALAMMLEAALTTGHQGQVTSLAVDVDRFDTHRYLLNTLNCVVDLRTGTAMPHDPGLMLSKLAPVIYKPTAQAPRLAKMVTEIMGGDAARVAFLQRVLGYLITGEWRERKVIVFVGLRGNNGKTTVANLLTGVMGAQFVSGLPVATLLERRFGADEIDVGLTTINGKRVVIAVEPNRNARFNSGIIKALSGGDAAGPMARRPHQRELEAVRPGAKILLLTNHVPSWEDDQSFNERFLLVPFQEEFRGSAERKDLSDELLAEEGPGILNWLIEGARMYYRDGLQVPVDIAVDTSELHRDATPADAWFRSCCSKDPNAVASVMDLYHSYTWHLSQMLHIPAGEVDSLKAFSQSLGNWKGMRFRERRPGSPNPVTLVRGIRLLVGAGGEVLGDL